MAFPTTDAEIAQYFNEDPTRAQGIHYAEGFIQRLEAAGLTPENAQKVRQYIKQPQIVQPSSVPGYWHTGAQGEPLRPAIPGERQYGPSGEPLATPAETAQVSPMISGTKKPLEQGQIIGVDLEGGQVAIKDEQGKQKWVDAAGYSLDKQPLDKAQLQEIANTMTSPDEPARAQERGLGIEAGTLGAPPSEAVAAQYEKHFEETHVKLADGKYMAVDDWNSLFKDMPEEQAHKYTEAALRTGGGLDALMAVIDAETLAQSEAIKTLDKGGYKRGENAYDIAKFLRDNPDKAEVLKKANYKETDIAEAKKFNNSYLGTDALPHIDRTTFIDKYLKEKGYPERPDINTTSPSKMREYDKVWVEAMQAYDAKYAPPMTIDQFVKNYFADKGWDSDYSKVVSATPTHQTMSQKQYNDRQSEAVAAYTQKYGYEPIVSQAAGKAADLLVPYSWIRDTSQMSDSEIVLNAVLDTTLLLMIVGKPIGAVTKGMGRGIAKGLSAVADMPLKSGEGVAVGSLRDVFGKGSELITKASDDVSRAIARSDIEGTRLAASKLRDVGEAMKAARIEGGDLIAQRAQVIIDNADYIMALKRTNMGSVLETRTRQLALDIQTVLSKEKNRIPNITPIAEKSPSGHSQVKMEGVEDPVDKDIAPYVARLRGSGINTTVSDASESHLATMIGGSTNDQQELALIRQAFEKNGFTETNLGKYSKIVNNKQIAMGTVDRAIVQGYTDYEWSIWTDKQNLKSVIEKFVSSVEKNRIQLGQWFEVSQIAYGPGAEAAKTPLIVTTREGQRIVLPATKEEAGAIKKVVTPVKTYPITAAEASQFGLTRVDWERIAEKVGNNRAAFLKEAAQVAKEKAATWQKITAAFNKSPSEPVKAKLLPSERQYLEEQKAAKGKTPISSDDWTEEQKKWAEKARQIDADKVRSVDQKIVEKARAYDEHINKLAAIAMEQIKAMTPNRVIAEVNNLNMAVTLAAMANNPRWIIEEYKQASPNAKADFDSKLSLELQQAIRGGNANQVRQLSQQAQQTATKKAVSQQAQTQTQTTTQTTAAVKVLNLTQAQTLAQQMTKTEVKTAAEIKQALETKPATMPATSLAMATGKALKAPPAKLPPKPPEKPKPPKEKPPPPKEQPPGPPPPIPKLGKAKQGKEGKEVSPSDRGAIGFQMGRLHKKPVIKIVRQPWKQSNLTTTVGNAPMGVTVTSGKGGPQRSITLISGKAPKRAAGVNIGITRAVITPGGPRRVTLSFERIGRRVVPTLRYVIRRRRSR